MKRIFDRSQLGFALMWIGIYCVLQSAANALNEAIGIDFSATAVLAVLQTLIIWRFVRRPGLERYFGLCRPEVPARRFLYYVPLAILASGNLWLGAAMNYMPAATVCRVIAMLFVGFLEEMIFRGFLFRALLRDNKTSAIIISSVTFGIGHLINLANGSGMDLVSNIIQVVFAVAVGFLFVIIFYRGGSLWPCILTHSAINTAGTFSAGEGAPIEAQMVQVAVLIAVAVIYTLILLRTLPRPGRLAEAE